MSESERRFEAIVAQAAVGIVVTDLAGRVVEANGAFCKLLGYADGEPIGGLIAELIAPEDRDASCASFEELVAGERTALELEQRYLRRDGSLVWGRANASIVRTSGDGPELVVATVEDIDVRRRTDARLREAEARYRTLIEELPLITYIDALDDRSSNIYTSPQLEPILGYSVEEWQSDPGLFERILHPEDRERVLEAVRVSNTSGARFSCEYRLRSHDGRYVWFHDDSVAVRDARGTPLYAQGYLLDVSERRSADEAIRRRDAILEAVGVVAGRLLTAQSWEDVDVTGPLGEAAGASCAYVYERRAVEDRSGATLRGEWRVDGASPSCNRSGRARAAAEECARWQATLGGGGVVNLPSLLLAPVFAAGEWWGAIGLEHREEERTWSEAEVDALRAAASILGAAIDRQTTVRSLSETTQTLEAIVDSSPLPIMTFDLEGRLTRWNQAAQRTFGWTEDEVLGRFNPMLPDGEEGRFRDAIALVLQGKSWRNVEVVRRTRDARLLDVAISAAPLRDAQGAPVGLLAMVADVSARKRAEAALRERDEQMRSLVANVPGAIYRCRAGPEWTIEVMTDAIQDITGYPASDFVGSAVRTYGSVIHPDDRADVVAAFDRSVERLEPVEVEYRIVHASGSVRWVTERSRPGGDPDGEAIWLDGTILDVTDRRRAEAERTQAQALLDTVFEELPTPLFIKDAADLRYMRVNRAAEELWGIARETLLGRNDRDVFPREQAELFAADDRTVLETGVLLDIPEEEVDTRRFGRRVTHTRKLPVPGDGGEIAYLLGLSTDVTEAKRARERLAEQQATLADQNERLRELDRLKDEFVALVSHELRTPLTSILGYLELILEGEAGELSEDQEQFLGIIERNSQRLLRLVGDLLFVAQLEAGKLSIEHEDVDLLAIARDCIEAARPRADDKRIEVRLEGVATGGLRGDRVRLAQLVDNLLSNAIKFTPDGGGVSVVVASRGGCATVAVSDTGMGIAEADRARLFERFFRSPSARRRAIQGTGLGLTITKAIAEAHGGSIAVESEEDRGTTFVVELPLLEAGGASSAGRPRAAEPRTGAE